MRDSLYITWAPRESIWSPWVKPVLFVSMQTFPPEPRLPDLTHEIPTRDEKTALVIDLAGAESVAFGLACLAQGWRPVPLFNALPDPHALVEMESVKQALWFGVPQLEAATLTPNAPPAFLLDARRQSGPMSPKSGCFDNRAVCFPSDFPSAVFLREHGISRVLLVQRLGDRPQSDLFLVLRGWQVAGIQIEVQPPEHRGTARACDLRPLSLLARLRLRLLVWLGLRPHPGGVFGELVEHGSAG